MRPDSLNNFRGQEKILGPGKPLRQWIENDQVPSLILWGPPGSGKTTLANIIAKNTKAHFEALSAVLAGVKEIKEVITRAKDLQRMFQQKTILFVDEIHRFNKSQQDALLPHVEDGTVTLIGATTENPSFELNNALLSRTRVVRLEPLTLQAISDAIANALSDTNRGLGNILRLTPEALEWLAFVSEGDMRKALTSLETIAIGMGKNIQAESQSENIPTELNLEQTKQVLSSTLERQPIQYDKNGEEHYNVISAFIKSLRDSDPQAALYYLARMLEGGEDPLFIARRLVIFSSEDIGNADPRGIMVAVATKEAVEFVGMPEARINLAQAVTYLALAPKSNASYEGINQALAEVRNSGALPVPLHLRNGVTKLMKDQGYGSGYRYVHNDPEAKTKQTHLPLELKNKKFYNPRNAGFEAELARRIENP